MQNLDIFSAWRYADAGAAYPTVAPWRTSAAPAPPLPGSRRTPLVAIGLLQPENPPTAWRPFLSPWLPTPSGTPCPQPRQGFFETLWATVLPVRSFWPFPTPRAGPGGSPLPHRTAWPSGCRRSTPPASLRNWCYPVAGGHPPLQSVPWAGAHLRNSLALLQAAESFSAPPNPDLQCPPAPPHPSRSARGCPLPPRIAPAYPKRALSPKLSDVGLKQTCSCHASLHTLGFRITLYIDIYISICVNTYIHIII